MSKVEPYLKKYYKPNSRVCNSLLPTNSVSVQISFWLHPDKASLAHPSTLLTTTHLWTSHCTILRNQNSLPYDLLQIFEALHQTSGQTGSPRSFNSSFSFSTCCGKWSHPPPFYGSTLCISHLFVFPSHLRCTSSFSSGGLLVLNK